VDAERPHHGPAAQKADEQKAQFDQELNEIAPEAQQAGIRWHHGDSPSLVLTWAVQALAKAGTLSIIGVYPPSDRFFPIGMAMNKNLTLKMGNCNHRQYIPMLIDLVRSGVIDPTEILTQTEPLTSVIEAYQAFDEHRPGWLKVELV
jgi:threonine dehydrogenase-like Zn-dependent dehydrogenase